MRLSMISMSCVLLACGGEDTSIVIQPMEYEPGCYVPPPPETPTETPSEALLQLATAHRQMLEFRISFGLQATQLLTRPVLEDPDASEWHIDKGRAIAEGKVVARGEGWSVLEMIVYTTEEYEGEPTVYRARINAVPNRTTYDFGGSIIDVRPDYFTYDDYARGCNPVTGVSFEIAPVITEDGVEQQTRCWPKPQLPSDADPEALAEFEASFRLQCHQMIERLRIP